jgi:hypothetical protein
MTRATSTVMGRLIDLIDRQRRRSSHDGVALQVLEPLYQALAIHRGELAPTLRFVRHHGLTCQGGPFAGMRYPRSAVIRVPGLVASLAGTYELELHPMIKSLIASRPRLLVNIGAGDGYYAIGMARRCPELKVIAYEADAYRVSVCRQLARLNGVENRVELHSVCTPDDLAALPAEPGAAVIADCEGAERELIDPGRVGWLRDATLLIEVHESIDPSLPAQLEGRFEPSHDLDWITPSRRYVWDPEYLLGWSAGLSPAQLEMVMAELRPVRTPWLWAVRAAGAMVRS